MNVELPRSSHPRPTAPRASPTMPKCTNGAIWSRTSSAVSRHSDASQPATKKPMLVLPASSISLPPSSQSGDCKQALGCAMEGPRILGDNGGPALDDDEGPEWGDGDPYVYFNWKAAHQKAWKPASRDMALFRLEKAEALGLTYEEY